ncbi:HAUS augmin-like complex subunit 8 isoform X3 [Balaenoptera musculus]|uniref:HAUS augmin-like complex subunit 8 isoform X3 n=1 Tax=Balaenoptera musculus TaxID=9771 RepID=A0A8B8XAV5_BALMU|nr:HAUS augmin-like complex subunit 8 isoform X3 [Balaenoptera musculus]
MADTSGRGAGKPSAGGPSTPSGAKMRGRRIQGGRVVESRYLQYEKKTTKKVTYNVPAADALKASGKMPEGGRKPNPLQKSKDSSGIGKGDLQSTLLEGHGTAPPDLDLSAINDKSVVRKTPQLEKTMSKKAESSSFSASRKKSPDLSEAMEMMESQTLLMTLLTLKVRTEPPARMSWVEGRPLSATEIEMLSPCEAIAGCFKERYKTFATALDTTRHELPVRSVHLDGDGQCFLDKLQGELTTTCHLLGELGISSSDENATALDLVRELKEMTQEKDLELQRSFTHVMELSAEASKEAALINQEAWEKAQGSKAPSQWYFNPEEAIGGEAWGELRSLHLSGHDEP